MSKEFGVSFSDPSSGERVQIRYVFREDDWSTLLAFARYAEDLESTTFFRNGGEIRANVEWDERTGVTDRSDLPDRAVVSELLHVLRPILLQSEATHFLSVCGIINRTVDHPHLRGLITRLRNHYRSDPKRQGWSLAVGNLTLNSEETLQKWLNAYEYHRDSAKREELEQAHGGPPASVSRAVFLMALIEKAEAAIALARLIRSIERGAGAEYRIRFTAPE